MALRVNIGCGRTPTRGWVNLDNSLSVRIAKLPPPALEMLRALRVLDSNNFDFARDASRTNVRYANAAKPLPFGDQTVDVIYTSHMLEHLEEAVARGFLREAYRVLCVGGVLRVVVPDLGRIVQDYLRHGDADQLMRGTILGSERPASFLERAKSLMLGGRGHAWMYDGPSLVRRLLECGFHNPSVVQPGETRIQEAGELDLAERADESLFVEATR